MSSQFEKLNLLKLNLVPVITRCGFVYELWLCEHNDGVVRLVEGTSAITLPPDWRAAIADWVEASEDEQLKGPQP